MELTKRRKKKSKSKGIKINSNERDFAQQVEIV